MDRCERVKSVAKKLAGSVSKLAATLGIPQTTLNGYLKHKRSDKLLPVLDKILEMYPQVCGDWLYFGTGSMLREESATCPDALAERGSGKAVSVLRNRLAELERSALENEKTIEFLKAKLAFMEDINGRQSREAERLAAEAERVTREAERLSKAYNNLAANRKYGNHKASDVQEEIMESSLDYGSDIGGAKLQEGSGKFTPDADVK